MPREFTYVYTHRLRPSFPLALEYSPLIVGPLPELSCWYDLQDCGAYALWSVMASLLLFLLNRLLGFMRQPDEPKSLSYWEEMGNPLILHNTGHLRRGYFLFRLVACHS